MTLHCMIDLETLSTSYNAVVTQIGYATFDPFAEVEGVIASNAFYLDPQPQMDRGLKMDWDTIKWWMSQDNAAREKFQNLTTPLAEAVAPLFDIGSMLAGVWSHGACFDVPILENLIQVGLKKKAPWDFRKVRDTRTLFELAGPALTWPENPIKHSAEHDALAQAITVQRAYKLIKGNHGTPHQ